MIPGSPNPFRLLDDLPERLPPPEPRASRHGQEADEHLLRVLRLCPGKTSAIPFFPILAVLFRKDCSK